MILKKLNIDPRGSLGAHGMQFGKSQLFNSLDERAVSDHTEVFG